MGSGGSDHYEEWRRRPDDWVYRTKECLEALPADTAQRSEMLAVLKRIIREREGRCRR